MGALKSKSVGELIVIGFEVGFVVGVVIGVGIQLGPLLMAFGPNAIPPLATKSGIMLLSAAV